MSIAQRFRQKLDHRSTSDFKPISSNLKPVRRQQFSMRYRPFVITATIVKINIYWHLIEIALAVAGNPRWAAGQFVEKGLYKQRSLYSKPRSKSSCGEEEKERGNGKEEVWEMLADGLHRFTMTEITAHAWTDPSIGWHLDLIHRLLTIKETDTGGVREKIYNT